MTGRRTYPASTERGVLDAEPGDYFKDEAGEWRGMTPNGIRVWLKNHHVEEHADGTITVVGGSWGSNSILAQGGPKTWHGFIERGVWRSC